VIIGPSALDSLGPCLAESCKARRTAVVTDDHVGPLYGEQVLASLRAAGFEPALIQVEAGESSKSLARLETLYDAFADARIDRGCPVVALGGGVVSDLAGFAAATWMRGVPLATCSTTLESDVDASVGGKTAVNHRSGKNMIGAFYQPRFVIIDTLTLRTLQERDYRAGLAESIKHAVIADAEFFDWHEAKRDEVLAFRSGILGELIERNVRIKADVVARDERETTGMRALLNFGHTIGHAVEAAMGRRGEPWRHGECVAVGMAAAAEMSAVAGRLERAAAERIVSLLKAYGLPVHAPLLAHREELLKLMSADKKVDLGRIRFVLADRLGHATLYDDIRPDWIDAGLDRVLG
jgi:3-dehydroquinate synthase